MISGMQYTGPGSKLEAMLQRAMLSDKIKAPGDDGNGLI